MQATIICITDSYGKLLYEKREVTSAEYFCLMILQKGYPDRKVEMPFFDSCIH
jgi:hypothetical protein